MKNVVSNLWFEKEAREAVEFYVSLVPNSAITRIATLPAESPSGPPDSVRSASSSDIGLTARLRVRTTRGPVRSGGDSTTSAAARTGRSRWRRRVFHRSLSLCACCPTFATAARTAEGRR